MIGLGRSESSDLTAKFGAIISVESNSYKPGNIDTQDHYREVLHNLGVTQEPMAADISIIGKNDALYIETSTDVMDLVEQSGHLLTPLTSHAM